MEIMHPDIWDEAYECACQRAHEEGDIDVDKDYTIMEQWQEEYYLDLCKNVGIEPYNERM